MYRIQVALGVGLIALSLTTCGGMSDVEVEGTVESRLDEERKIQEVALETKRGSLAKAMVGATAQTISPSTATPAPTAPEPSPASAATNWAPDETLYSLLTGSSKHHYQSGNEYYQLGDYQKAIEQYTWAIRLGNQTPEESTLFYNRGLSYHKLGQYERAILDYDRARAGDKSLAYRGKAIAYYQIAVSAPDIDTKVSNLPSAASAIERVLDFFPNDAWAYHLMTNIYYGMATYQNCESHMDSAQEYLKKAKSLGADDSLMSDLPNFPPPKCD